MPSGFHLGSQTGVNALLYIRQCPTSGMQNHVLTPWVPSFALDDLAKDRLILGDPDECVQQLHRWSEAPGANCVMMRLRHAHSGGPPHGEIIKAIELFGSRVAPQLT